LGGHRFAVALACVAVLAGCETVRTTSPGTVGVERQSLLLVSSSQMMAGAKNSYDQVIGQARAQGRLNTDPVMAQRVRQIGQRLVPPTTVFRPDAVSWDWEFNVIHEKTINAWCMPGGKIAFYSEIIQRLQLDDEEIAAIMGHEIAHALREHGRERVSQTLVARFGLNMLQLAGSGPVVAGQVANAVQLGWLLPNSREHETEADRIGVELSARAGYDPRAAVRVWQKMSKLGGSSGPEFSSTHPSHERRIADLTVYSQKVLHLYEGAKK
jgi:predicted Zn-dependent protease